MRKKSETFTYFQRFKTATMLQFPKNPIKIFRSDRGGEFLSGAFTDYLYSTGITRELTQSYTPHQNGVSERKNRTLLEKARSMFIEARTPNYLWAEAVNTMNYLTNRSPTRANGGVSPYQRLFKKPPSLSHLRIFGCIAYVHEPDERRTKLESKSRKCILVGYSEETKGYRCYEPSTRKIHISGDVQFQERRFWHTPSDLSNPTPSMALEPLSDHSAAIEIFDPILVPSTLPCYSPLDSSNHPAMPSSLDHSSDLSDQPSLDPPIPLRVYVRRNRTPPDSLPTATETIPSVAPDHPDSAEFILRRSSRVHELPHRFHDYVMNIHTVSDALACVYFMGEPQSYAQASLDPNWRAAMDDEMASIHANQTWILIPRPPRITPLHVKWVYKLKIDTDGNPIRYKARLVARGDEQLDDIDYNETFSPVVKWSTMRSVVSLAAMRGWELHHLDVKCAFLNGNIDGEDVYLHQPSGYVASGFEHCVCHLRKTIYGLRQSARRWNSKLDDELIAFGFVQSHSDPSMYILIENDLILIFIIYVDDLLLSGNHSSKILLLEQRLKSQFQMSSLGLLAVYLGVRFFYEPAGILMSHTHYIQRCLDELGLANCLPASVPIDPSIHLS